MYRKSASNQWKILTAIERKPMTVADLMPVIGLKYEATARYVKKLRRDKRIHVCDHIRTGGNPHLVYALGNKPDVEIVPTKVRTAKGPRRFDVMLGRAIGFLREKPRTAAELAELMHVCKDHARRYLNHLLESNPRCVYLKEWRPALGRGNPAPVYALGNKPDVPKPKSSRHDRYQKEKRDRECYERILLKQRQRYKKQKDKSKPTSPFAALGI